jgi:hypothetical protein
MKEAWDWITSHWESIAATVAAIFGGGVAGKKFVDKEQDSKIKNLVSGFEVLSEKAIKMEERISKVELDIETNTKFDKQFRDQMKEERAEIKDMMKELSGSVKDIYNYLLNNKTTT